jgi:hypothetical protein
MSVASLRRLIRHAQSIPALARHGSALCPQHIREYLLKKKMHARDLFKDFYTEEPAKAALTYQWTLAFNELPCFLNSPNIREFNGHHPDHPPLPEDMELLTIWIDVLQLDQNCEDMSCQLLMSEAEYKEAEFHIVAATRTVFERAWCLHETATRARAGKRSHVLTSYKCQDVPHQGENFNLFDVAALADNTHGHFYHEMQATNDTDLVAIKEHIIKSYITPERFDKAIIRILHEAAL